MKNHTQLLNYLAETFNLQSYLEIGVQNPVNNFDKIKCKVKYGCDPNVKSGGNEIVAATSDEFFGWNHGSPFNLIFIDGLHHADQVKRDFENSLKCLTDNGFIVIHDTLPEKEEYTHVPRDSKMWNGDVYKFACTLGNYPGINFCTLNIDHGCTVVWRTQNNNPCCISSIENWAEFQQHKKHLLRITPIEIFKEFLRGMVAVRKIQFNINQLS